MTDMLPPMLHHAALNLPSIRHGFFGRAGGISRGIYDGLNVGLGSDDDRAVVLENRARAMRALGFDASALTTVHQVHGVDVVTLSGSGEPTLALNIDEIIDAIHRIGNKPVMVLTNSTWLGDGATQARLMKADTVACKLDASNDATLQKVNRPADGVTLSSIVDGIKSFRAVYTGKLALQCMLMPMNRSIVHELSELIREIQPDEVHLNTPRRPKPRSWYLGARGNHVGDSPVATVMLKTITLEEARDIEHELRAAIPTVPILSIYQDAPKD